MLLDTDILIDLLRGNQHARDFVYSVAEDSPHCCSAITVGEIHSGMREAERARTTELIESLVVLPVTREIAEAAGKFRREYNKAERRTPARLPGVTANPETEAKPGGAELELDDCLIAATAAVEGLELATRNTRHYPMKEIRIRSAGY
jgi:predicted nucleic acid-binding protein